MLFSQRTADTTSRVYITVRVYIYFKNPLPLCGACPFVGCRPKIGSRIRFMMVPEELKTSHTLMFCK